MDTFRVTITGLFQTITHQQSTIKQEIALIFKYGYEYYNKYFCFYFTEEITFQKIRHNMILKCLNDKYVGIFYLNSSPDTRRYDQKG
jgi:hypothetical protein